MDVFSYEVLEKQFIQKMQNRVKSQMILKYFRQTTDIYSCLDVPLFTEFSGEKQIVPFRNTSCMTYKCIYDIDELVAKYKSGAYSNYLTFICHTCRKLIDIQDFYRDIELDRIINKIWMKHNINNKIICAAVTIYRSGEWEPVLPNYVRKLEKLMEKREPQLKVEIPNPMEEEDEEEEQVALQNVEVYETIPMMDKFDYDEYKRLLSEFIDEDTPRYDNEIILKRYKQQLKWGEFTHIRGQTAFLQAPMSIYVSYLSDYYYRKVGSQRLIAFCVIKVSSYDSYRFKAQFYYVTDNFETLPGPIADTCRKAVFVINFDERWMLVILDLKTKSIKLLDFLDDQISRYRQDELYEMSMYIVEQVCPPIKLKRSFGYLKVERDQLNAKIIQEQIQELRKKVQYYTDCGHQMAQYLYYFVKQEIDHLTSQLPQVESKIGEKDLFTVRLCWLFLKMTHDEVVKIPFYQFKPQAPIREDSKEYKKANEEDSLDQLIRTESQIGKKPSKILLNVWDFSRKEGRKTNINNTVGNILNVMDQSQIKSNSVTQQLRASKYWDIPLQKAGSIGQQVSPKSIIKKQDSTRFNSNTQFKSAFIDPKEQKQKENPFFSMPRWQLQEYMEKYKVQIMEDYRQQAVVKHYHLQDLEAEQRIKTLMLDLSISQNDDLKLTKSQYNKLFKQVRPQSVKEQQYEDEDLKKLQKELGLDDADLANMDVYNYIEKLKQLNEKVDEEDDDEVQE